MKAAQTAGLQNLRGILPYGFLLMRNDTVGGKGKTITSSSLKEKESVDMTPLYITNL